MARGEFADFDSVDRLLELGVEIVNPELVEVAHHDIGRAVRDEVEPVVESLLVVAGELLAARFHLDEHASRPDQVGIFGSVARKVDPILEGPTFRERVAVVPERFE